MWITRVSIKNPVFATMVMIGIAVLGIFSYNRLRVEQMPDVSLPFVLVLTAYPGANPEVVESGRDEAARVRDQHRFRREPDPVELARGPEPGLRRVPDVDRHDEGDAGRPRQDRAGPAELPAATSRSRSSSAPTRRTSSRSVSLAVLSPTMNLRDLTSLTDQTIVKGLENVPGVARIDVNGRVTRQILIQIKPNAVSALGIGVDQVINAVRAANQDVPRGPHHARASPIRSSASKARSRTRRSSRASSSRSRAAHRSTCRRSPT